MRDQGERRLLTREAINYRAASGRPEQFHRIDVLDIAADLPTNDKVSGPGSKLKHFDDELGSLQRHRHALPADS